MPARKNRDPSSTTVARIPKRLMGEWQQLLRAAFFARWGSPYRRTDFFHFDVDSGLRNLLCAASMKQETSDRNGS